MIGWSSNEAFRLDNYLILEKTMASMKIPGGAQETWLLFNDFFRNDVYTGGSVFHRQGLLSTAKGGAKPVRATIISQVVTDFALRCCGLATHFLNLLAAQMDSREDDEQIAFSVLYSGPKTDLFQRCGWKPLPAKQLRIALGGLQMSELLTYLHRYPKYEKYTRYLFENDLERWH